MEEYAEPVRFKDPKFGPGSANLVPNLVPEPENLVPKLRRPKPSNTTTKHTLKEIQNANHNPFNQNYAIVSPSRYSCNYRTRAIITRGLYTFYPIFEGQKRLFKELVLVKF